MEITTEMINETLFEENNAGEENIVNEQENDPENLHIESEEKQQGTPGAEESKPSVQNAISQSDDERRRNAAIRRERERAQYESFVQKKVDAAYAAAFSGQTNPFSGKPILTEKDYNEYKHAMSEKEFQEAGVSLNAVNEMINAHPAIKRANEIAERADAERREAEAQKGRIEMEKQIKLISAIDPDIKGIEDLINSPNVEKFNELISHGNSLYDSYRLANIDKIMGKEAARAKQETLNTINGKGHMTPVTSSHTPSDEVDVPVDVANIYRSLMPEMSSEEIRKDYNKRRNK